MPQWRNQPYSYVTTHNMSLCIIAYIITVIPICHTANTVDDDTHTVKAWCKHCLNVVWRVLLISFLAPLSSTLLGAVEGQTFSASLRVMCIHKTKRHFPASPLKKPCISIEISRLLVSIKSSRGGSEITVTKKTLEKGKLSLRQGERALE